MKDKSKEIHSSTKQSEEDKALWGEVTKDVEPLKGKEFVSNSLDQGGLSSGVINKSEVSFSKEAKSFPKREISKSRDIDHRTGQRLKRGKLDIDARLDLHGMSQNQAYDALLDFFPKAYTSGKRCVLVVTGKGYKRHGDQSLLERTDGVLKQKTPQWLNDAPLSQYILNIQIAKPKHGGEGALYVLLRRNRE